MVHKNYEILDYWNRDNVESMYDKHLIRQEINMIKSKIDKNSKILDAGCGEGEGTLQYALIPGVIVHAADFSDTRLKRAKKILAGIDNVNFFKVDFLRNYELEGSYDYIVCQRFLINLIKWELQKKVILDLTKLLKQRGKLILLEGSNKGVNELNNFRKIFDLKPIEIKWHNLFIDDNKLERFLRENRLNLIEKDGLGEYFLLTRGIRPSLSDDLNWKSKFNENSANPEVRNLLGFKDKFSRLKLWVIEKT